MRIIEKIIMVLRHCPVRALRSRRLISATTVSEESALPRFFERVKNSCSAPAEEAGGKAVPPSCYVGFDPTADALHVGNLVSLRVLQVLQHHGLRPIALVGGATGLIGDPSGRSTERNMQSEELIRSNAKGIEKCVRRLLMEQGTSRNEADGVTSDDDRNYIYAPTFVNNLDWYVDKTPLDFVRDVGRHFRMGAMLSRESVRSRLDSDQGMSFTEFSYQLFQAYDFLHLHREFGCVMQVGGSDQWGNIVGGCDLVRRVVDVDDSDSAETDVALKGATYPRDAELVFPFLGEAHGLTVPLLTSSTGEKLGKSAGNAIWVDPDKTSPYEFYQYFMGVSDADVEQCCAMLSMDPRASSEEVDEIMRHLMSAHEKAPEKRIPQRHLAEAMTRWVHGEEGLERAKRASETLFGGQPGDDSPANPGAKAGLGTASVSDMRALMKDAPTYSCSKSDLLGTPLVSLAVDAGAFKSKGEAKRMIKSGGFYVNQARVDDSSRIVEENDLLGGTLVVLRVGRKKHILVECL